MYSERRKASHLSSDDGDASPFLNSPSPVPLSVLVTHQGSPPLTSKDSSSSPCASISSSSYGHFTTNAANAAATLNPLLPPTPRSANVSPQPRVFTIASLLNDPPPEQQQPKPRPPPPPPQQQQVQQPYFHHQDHHHYNHTNNHNHYFHYPRKVAVHHLAVQEKENRRHQNHASHPSPPLLSSDPDDETEMAPPRKPDSSQRRRPIPTPPANLLDSPTSIDSEPAIRHTAPAPTSPGRDEAQLYQQRLHQSQSQSQSQAQSQRDRERERELERQLRQRHREIAPPREEKWGNEQPREWNQFQHRDQRGDPIARETAAAAPTKITKTTVTTASVTTVNPPSPITGASPKKKESVSAAKSSRVRPVDASVMPRQPWVVELPTDDEKISPPNQDDADTRNPSARAASGKPATPQKSRAADAATTTTTITTNTTTTKEQKSHKFLHRPRAAADVEEPVSAKKYTVSVPRYHPEANSSSRNSSSSSSRNNSRSSSRIPAESGNVKAPEKSEEAIPRNQIPINSVEDKEDRVQRESRERREHREHKLEPVAQEEQTTDSTVNEAPLAGTHIADAMTTTLSKAATPPRGAKRSQSLSPFDDGGPASPVKKLKTERETELASQNILPSPRQLSEDILIAPVSTLVETADNLVLHDVDIPRSQSMLHTEATFTLVEPDDDILMTSAEPEAPVAPMAMMDATSVDDMDEERDVGDAVALHSEIKGDSDQVEHEHAHETPEDHGEGEEMKPEPSLVEQMVEEIVKETEVKDRATTEDEPMRDQPADKKEEASMVVEPEETPEEPELEEPELEKPEPEKPEEKLEEKASREPTEDEDTPTANGVEEATARDETPEPKTTEEKPLGETPAPVIASSSSEEPPVVEMPAKQKTPEAKMEEEEKPAEQKTPEAEVEEAEKAQEETTPEQVPIEARQKETPSDKAVEVVAPVETPVETPKKRKIVITKRSSTAPSADASPKAPRKNESFNGLPFIVKNHDRCSGDDFEFQLQVVRPGETQPSWEEEKSLFLESPETVVKYWDTVPGGREEACEGMWKIYKVWDERKMGRKTKYQVGWIGSLERGWEWRNMLVANAKEVLDDWEQLQAAKQAKKEAKQEGGDYELDAEQQQHSDQDDEDEGETRPKNKQRRGSFKKSRTSMTKPQKAAAATAKRIKFVNRRERSSD